MSWEIEYTDQFGDWFQTLTEAEQERIAMVVVALETRGTNLGSAQFRYKVVSTWQYERAKGKT